MHVTFRSCVSPWTYAYGIRIDHTFALRAVAGDGVAGNLNRAWGYPSRIKHLQKHATDCQRPLFFAPMPDRVFLRREGSVFFPTKFRRMSVAQVSTAPEEHAKAAKSGEGHRRFSKVGHL